MRHPGAKELPHLEIEEQLAEQKAQTASTENRKGASYQQVTLVRHPPSMLLIALMGIFAG